ncbi:hypothetical protein E2C01_003139 [Portunus trituberculatus]|uniref:Uncharacterized protein n=1 Tax=Portunus trituberculatus TaxID=210409 RepID=A0A5B7CSQ5_PORTR|nr:hypothetical protein [Portunus trituberculatus]
MTKQSNSAASQYQRNNGTNSTKREEITKEYINIFIFSCRVIKTNVGYQVDGDETNRASFRQEVTM